MAFTVENAVFALVPAVVVSASGVSLAMFTVADTTLAFVLAIIACVSLGVSLATLTHRLVLLWRIRRVQPHPDVRDVHDALVAMDEEPVVRFEKRARRKV